MIAFAYIPPHRETEYHAIGGCGAKTLNLVRNTLPHDEWVKRQSAAKNLSTTALRKMFKKIAEDNQLDILKQI